MKKFSAFLLAVCLTGVTLPVPSARAQVSPTEGKFLLSSNPIPDEFIVVLRGTNFDPLPEPSPAPSASPAPSPSPSPNPVPTAEPMMTAAADAADAQSARIAPTEPVVDEPIGDAPEPVAPEDPAVVETARSLTSTYGGTIGKTFGSALKGFELKASAETARAISEDPRVAFVEQNGIAMPDNTQWYPTWGLDRIDQRFRPLSNTFSYRATGAGVNVYVIDSGIRTSHSEFGGRARVGFDALGGNGQDCNGHGTHVAGTIGGRTYGVAKNARLLSVRVFGCTGGSSWSTIINAVNWVTWHRQQPGQRFSPAVANMSLGGPVNTSLDTAVRNSIRANITYAVAAGNEYATDARLRSPARVAEAITVGATNIFDQRAVFSNIGPGIDLFAPGEGVTSAWFNHDFATRVESGTSMAAPHVAGVAALYLQGNPGAQPATVSWVLTANATHNVIGNVGWGSPNRLLFTNF